MGFSSRRITLMIHFLSSVCVRVHIHIQFAYKQLSSVNWKALGAWLVDSAWFWNCLASFGFLRRATDISMSSYCTGKLTRFEIMFCRWLCILEAATSATTVWHGMRQLLTGMLQYAATCSSKLQAYGLSDSVLGVLFLGSPEQSHQRRMVEIKNEWQALAWLLQIAL